MKKLIASSLAAVMLAAAVPALGAEKIAAQEAIAAAKTVLPIPEELTEFSYNANDEGYILSWTDKGYEKNASAAINSEGVIIGYSFYDGSVRSGLSKLRKSELAAKAADFLKKTVPELAGRLVVSEDSNARRIVFDRYENGVRVEGNQAVIYFTNDEIRDYSLSWDFESDFSGEKKLTSDEAAVKLAENAVALEYNAFFPLETEAGETAKAAAFPVYKSLDSIYINAADGSAFEGSVMYRYMNTMKEAAAEDGAMPQSSGGGYRLTQEELTEVDAMSKLVSSDTLLKKLAELTELWLPEKYSVSTEYYTAKTKDKTDYSVSLVLENESGERARVSADGQSGEIKSITVSRKGMYNEVENPVSAEECQKTAESLLKKLRSLDGYRLYGENSPVQAKRTDDNTGFYTAKYVKYIGEIPFPADNKQVNISRISGKATSFYENIPDAELAIPDALTDKLEAVKKNYTPELVYTYADDKPVLAYSLKANGEFFAVRAENGEAIDYSGAPVKSFGEKADETGHWAWNAFDILRENDIYVEGDYMLDDFIGGEDFDTLVRRSINIGAMPYRGYYRESDDRRSSNVVTREEAVNTVAGCLGWERLINLDVFTTSFADEDDFEGGIGGAAILQALDVIRGENGSFFPKRTLTYGEAYSMAYKLASMPKESDGVMPAGE